MSKNDLSLAIAEHLYSEKFNTLLNYKERFWIRKKNHYVEIKNFETKILKALQNDEAFKDFANPNHIKAIVEQLKALTLIDQDEEGNDKGFHFYMGDHKDLGEDYLCFLPLKTKVLLFYRNGGTKLVDSSTKFFCTSSLNFDLDIKAKCPSFEKFLTEMQKDEDDRKMLQEICGYMLLPEYSELHKFVIFLGTGANGKSVFTKALRALLGRQNVSSVDLSAFKESSKYKLGATVGKLANICEDLSSSGKLQEGKLKQFVSGEPITIEEKYKPPFDYTPRAKLLFCTNSPPNFSDKSDGIYRRLILHEWTERILDPKKQNKELCTVEYWENSGELAGILNWAIEGAVRILKRDPHSLYISPNATKTTDDFQNDSVFIRTFLTDHYVYDSEADPKHGTNIHDLYKHYSFICKEFKISSLGRAQFARVVHEVFPLLRNKDNFKQEEIKLRYNGSKSHKTRVRFYPKLLRVPHIKPRSHPESSLEEFIDNELDLL